MGAKCLIEFKNQLNKKTISLDNPTITIIFPVKTDLELNPIENIEFLIKDYEIATIDALINSIPNWFEYIGYYESLKFLSKYTKVIEVDITKKIKFKIEYFPLQKDLSNNKAYYETKITLILNKENSINNIDEKINSFLSSLNTMSTTEYEHTTSILQEYAKGIKSRKEISTTINLSESYIRDLETKLKITLGNEEMTTPQMFITATQAGFIKLPQI